MSEKESMFVFIVGLLLTMGGVGGIEQSLTDAQMLDGVLIAVVGLLVMWVGTIGMKQVDKTLGR